METNSDSSSPLPPPPPHNTVPQPSPASAPGPGRVYRIHPNTFNARCFNIPSTPLNMFERGRMQLRYYGLLRASVFAGCDRSAEEDEVFSLKEGGVEKWYIHRPVGLRLHAVHIFCSRVFFLTTLGNQAFPFVEAGTRCKYVGDTGKFCFYSESLLFIGGTRARSTDAP
jgi:hypothetical protein